MKRARLLRKKGHLPNRTNLASSRAPRSPFLPRTTISKSLGGCSCLYSRPWATVRATSLPRVACSLASHFPDLRSLLHHKCQSKRAQDVWPARPSLQTTATWASSSRRRRRGSTAGQSGSRRPGSWPRSPSRLRARAVWRLTTT